LKVRVMPGQASTEWRSVSSAGFARATGPRGMLERGAKPPFEWFKRISSHVTALVFPILEEV
jgi:hypothetical protein